MVAIKAMLVARKKRIARGLLYFLVVFFICVYMCFKLLNTYLSNEHPVLQIHRMFF